MATYVDLADALKRIAAASADPSAWMLGLTPADIAAVLYSRASPTELDGLLAKIRAAHPDVFGPSPNPSPRSGEGAAADAIRTAEAALAMQNSQAAQLDLQVLTAVLNAHATAADGAARLTELQRQIEEAVAARTDLGTPAGARDFQRFLIGKLREIREVLDSAGLDATSKAALAAALASLYASAAPEPVRPAAEPGPVSPGRHTGSGGEGAPAPEEFAAYDDTAPAPPWTDAAPPGAPPVAPSAVAPALPTPTPMSGAMPGGSGLSGLSGLGSTPWPDALRAALPTSDPKNGLAAEDSPDGSDTEPEYPAEDPTEAPVDDPTTVHLPDGATVNAPSPEVAAAITAALAGAPIADAFGWQGITIPSPGSTITSPVAPTQLIPGDVGFLTDRHAIALGNGTVLLDRKILPIASVIGPGFLGWQHPPAPEPAHDTAAARTPDRPALTAPS